MPKTLCKWKKKDIDRHVDELAVLVAAPRFVCRNCARAAHSKSSLCKAMKLPQSSRE